MCLISESKIEVQIALSIVHLLTTYPLILHISIFYRDVASY